MEININTYNELIKVGEQKNVLIREMNARAKARTDWISFDALKAIFDLQDIVPEVKCPDDKDV